MSPVFKVCGPPGTGKTTWAINKVAEYLEQGISPERIAFCTFTRAAANHAIKKALDKFSYPQSSYKYFGTEHAIAFRLLGLSRKQVFTGKLLREFGKVYKYEFGSNDELNIDQRFSEAMLVTLYDYYEFFVSWSKSLLLPFPEAYRKYVLSNTLPDGWSKEGLETYINRRIAWKQENHLWDFGDFLYGCLQNKLYPEVDVLILDEAQDQSTLLWSLIKFWSSKVQDTYIIGDERQAIYSWAGATPEAFLSFPCDGQETLKQSYRLPVNIKNYAVKIIEPLGLPIQQFEPRPASGTVKRLPFDGINLSGNAFILCRTRWLCSQVYDELILRGIPFSSERYKQNPLSTKKGRAYLGIIKLRDGDKLSTGELRAIAEFTRKPFIKYGAKTRIKEMVDSDWSRFHILQLFTTEILNHEPYDILCQGIETGDINYMYSVYKNFGREALEKDSGVILTTIHGSKGREKRDVIILPDMTDRVYKSYCRQPKEEILLNYTGCTRAIESLTILFPFHSYFFPFPSVK